MQLKIFPAARHRIIEIWHYTDKTWGERQADKYVRGLYNAMDEAGSKKYLWRKIQHKDIKRICFVRHKHHYIFFRELSKKILGIIKN